MKESIHCNLEENKSLIVEWASVVQLNYEDPDLIIKRIIVVIGVKESHLKVIKEI